MPYCEVFTSTLAEPLSSFRRSLSASVENSFAPRLGAGNELQHLLRGHCESGFWNLRIRKDAWRVGDTSRHVERLADCNAVSQTVRVRESLRQKNAVYLAVSVFAESEKSPVRFAEEGTLTIPVSTPWTVR